MHSLLLFQVSVCVLLAGGGPWATAVVEDTSSNPIAWLWLVPLGLVLVLPVSLTLWMRQRTLQKAQTDSAGAWYGYGRFSRWLVLATWLTWLTATALLPNPAPYFNLLPPALVLICCQALAHPVYTGVRSIPAKRSRLILWALVCQAVYFWAFSSLATAAAASRGGEESSFASHYGGNLLALWAAVFAAWFMLEFFFRRLRLLPIIFNPLSKGLTDGELYERVMALARQAGVRVRHLFVAPSGNSQLANAFAMQGNVIGLTDSVLESLNRREVDAVMAHELGHIRLRHLLKFPATFLGLLLISLIAVKALAPSLLEPAPAELSWVMVALALIGSLYVLRRFERAADAESVRLTGDPEAFITALVKLTRLNLMPLQWNTWEERFGSHPSTLHRVQAVARQAGWAPERLQALLEAPDGGGEGYALPDNLREDRIFSGKFRGKIIARRFWTTVGFLLLTPVLTAYGVELAQWQGAARWISYLAGCLATVGLCLWVENTMPHFRWHGSLQQQLCDKLKREGLDVDAGEGIFVRFAPGTLLHRYDIFFEWDVGLLFLQGDRFSYVGERTRFALRRTQITGFHSRPGLPGWLTHQLVRATWRDAEQGMEGAFLIAPGVAHSELQMARTVRDFEHHLQVWLRERPAMDHSSSLLSELQLPPNDPALGGELYKALGFGETLMVLASLLLFAGVIVGLMGLPFALPEGGAAWYVFAVVCFVLVFDELPSWRYREPDDQKGPVPCP